MSEVEDGWRYSLRVTDLPARLPNQIRLHRRAQRVHARVKGCVRTGKDSGIGKLPQPHVRPQPGLARRRADPAALLTWRELLALEGPLAKAEPKALRDRIVHTAAA